MTDVTDNPAALALAANFTLARDALRDGAFDEETVHAARKALKTARAALRLMRRGLAPADYRRANLACRDAGHYLSPLRDAHVLLRALDRFAAGDAAGLRAIADTRRLLESERDQHLAELDTPEIRSRCVTLLELGCAPALAPAAASLGAGVLRRGLRRLYRNARRAFVIARRERDGEHLHEWRKQTKYLRTGAQQLAGAGARGLAKTIKRTARIAELLGDEHDLAVLERTLRARGGDIDAPELISRIARRRRVLQAKALRLGETAFAQRTRAFEAGVKLCSSMAA